MTEITAAMVQELREATNVSMMECKRALVEAGGDKERAIRLLRERGVAIAAKKSSRQANQGLIAAAVCQGQVGALIEVNCETDFVAKNPGFQAFVQSLADKAAADERPITEWAGPDVSAKVAEIGENIVARRSTRYTLQGPGLIAAYIHLHGKVGVLLELGCTRPETAATAAFQELAKDLTLHVTAAQPRWLDRSAVPADVLDAERDIYRKQVTNKPPPIVEKIVDGKMTKFFAQVCLVDQGFVKDPDTPVSRLLAAKGKELGDTLSVRRFVRYQVGGE